MTEEIFSNNTGLMTMDWVVRHTIMQQYLPTRQITFEPQILVVDRQTGGWCTDE